MRFLFVLPVLLMMFVAFTSTSSVAQANDVMIKLKKGSGLTFQTADKNYKLKMRLNSQFLTKYVNEEGDDNDGLGFSVRRIDLFWMGNVFAPWMKYKIQYDLANNGQLLDFYLLFAKDKRLAPILGQYKVPFNREFLNATSTLQLVDYSILTNYLGFHRDIGGGVYGFLGDDGMIRYELGVFQGEGSNVKNDNDTDMLWVGRIQASVLGGKINNLKENFAKKPTLTIGAALAGINVEDGNDKNIGIPRGERKIENGSVISFTADASYIDPRFNLTGEYIGRWINPDGVSMEKTYDYGFRAQGGFFLLPKKIEIATRYAQIFFDDDKNVVAGNDLDNIWAVTPGINYYISGDHNWKLQVDYTFQRKDNLDGTEIDENMIRAQVQAHF